MPTTKAKISIAIDTQQLGLARSAAKAEGLSLSAYIAQALGRQLEDQGRNDAARELHAGWHASTIPIAADRDAFLSRMSRPRRRRSDHDLDVSSSDDEARMSRPRRRRSRAA